MSEVLLFSGNFRMQQFPQQYMQPGMVRYPMMPGHMMPSHGQLPRQPPNMMFHGQVSCYYSLFGLCHYWVACFG